MPILKQLVAGSSQTKTRRSRMDLTTEMISAPLGDFRHTMHVGRSGEAFGDTSFLSTRSGEPPRETEPAFPRSPKPGLLARTFRSSKRSHSMNRADQQLENTLAPPDGSPTFVKNAMSLPFLNEGDGEPENGGRVHKSLTSSPMRQAAPASAKSSNGALPTGQVLDLEQHEQLFGVLTDLRSTGPYNGGGGMKKAESVMSFHVDLGPSMLGDILDVMEIKDDDLGFEEGKGSEGRDSPQFSVHTEDEEGDKEVDEEEKDHKGEDIEEASHDQEEEEEEEEEKDEEVEDNVKGKMIEAEIIEDHSDESDPEQPQPEQQQYALEQEQVKDVHVGVEDAQDLNDRATPRPPSSVDLDSQSGSGAPYTPELMPKHLQNSDSCSMSSTGSAAVAERPPSPSPQLLEVEEAPGMTRYSPPPPVEEGEFSSFIEDEDDEIRV